MILGIDFDGTVVSHEYPDIGDVAPGVFTWLKEFQKNGIKLILWTMRDGKELEEAVEFCKKNGIEFYGINENPTQKSWTTSPKAYCNYYIDDAAVNCPLLPNQKAGGRQIVDWSIVGPMVMKLFGKKEVN